MAKSKEDIMYGTAQANLSEDESLRVRYKHGTSLEGGKIADSEPVDLFSSAHSIPKSNHDVPSDSTAQSQLHPDPDGGTTAPSNPAAAASTLDTSTTGGVGKF